MCQAGSTGGAKDWLNLWFFAGGFLVTGGSGPKMREYDEGSGRAIEVVPPCPRKYEPVRYY